jgi:hypothetical protein
MAAAVSGGGVCRKGCDQGLPSRPLHKAFLKPVTRHLRSSHFGTLGDLEFNSLDVVAARR